MKNGVAAWHYPHRTTLENVEYFISRGHESISLLGSHFNRALSDEQTAQKLAELVKESGIILSVHYKLPLDHSEEKVSEYKEVIDRYADWQDKYGLIEILSFDVEDAIRDNVTAYIEYAMEKVNCPKIAVEDFGLNESERAQLKVFKGNERFGYLVDIGHTYIRMRGQNQSGKTLFTNAPDECPICEKPSFDEFLKAIKSKDFPIFEIHLHNNNGDKDMHNFLEIGDIDMSVIARVLKEIDFDGILTIESAPGFQFKCVYPESDIKINQTFDYWKNLIK